MAGGGYGCGVSYERAEGRGWVACRMSVSWVVPFCSTPVGCSAGARAVGLMWVRGRYG